MAKKIEYTENTFKVENRELNVIYDGEVVWFTHYLDNKAVKKEILNAELSKDRIAGVLQDYGVETVD